MIGFLADILRTGRYKLHPNWVTIDVTRDLSKTKEYGDGEVWERRKMRTFRNKLTGGEREVYTARFFDTQYKKEIRWGDGERTTIRDATKVRY